MNSLGQLYIIIFSINRLGVQESNRQGAGNGGKIQFIKGSFPAWPVAFPNAQTLKLLVFFS
jgi:hypothetical protein